MNPPALTIEQQRDYVRRMEEGWRAAKADQMRTVQNRTADEAWAAMERVLGGPQAFTPERALRRASSGLVEQQRLFGKLHRR